MSKYVDSNRFLLIIYLGGPEIMFKNELTKLETFFLASSKKNRTIIAIIIGLSLPLIYLLVLKTGGIKYSYSHIMYIPIVLAGLILGKSAGIIIGVIAGVLLGPFTPIETTTMELQLFINWFLRLLIYGIIGYLSGLFSSILKNASQKLIKLYSYNPETMIPNTHILSSLNINDNPNTEYLLTTVLINNHLTIVELIGNEKYLIIVKEIYKRLKEQLKNYIVILQGESNKFWIAKKK